MSVDTKEYRLLTFIRIFVSVYVYNVYCLSCRIHFYMLCIHIHYMFSHICHIPCSVRRLQSLMYDQITRQNKKMNPKGQHLSGMPLRINMNIGKTVKIYMKRITRDGYCLYRALAHQIFNVELDSNQHIAKTKKLLDETVKGLIKRVKKDELYKDSIAVMIAEEFNDEHETSLEPRDITIGECVEFIKKRYRDPECWGGDESMGVISKRHGVNIFILYENHKTFGIYRFDPKRKRTVFIIWRYNYETKENDHFDSVSHIFIDENDLKVFVRNEIKRDHK